MTSTTIITTTTAKDGAATTTVDATALDRLYEAVEQGRPIDDRLLADDVVLDATVPMWRFTRRGPRAVATEFGRWFADPGRFEDFRRIDLADGALVEFVLTWEHGGVPHACHQSHRLELQADGRIRRITAFCGGRWPASLLAEMARAEHEAVAQQ